MDGTGSEIHAHENHRDIGNLHAYFLGMSSVLCAVLAAMIYYTFMKVHFPANIRSSRYIE